MNNKYRLSFLHSKCSRICLLHSLIRTFSGWLFASGVATRDIGSWLVLSNMLYHVGNLELFVSSHSMILLMTFCSVNQTLFSFSNG
jgi:hypothetical protein